MSLVSRETMLEMDGVDKKILFLVVENFQAFQSEITRFPITNLTSYGS